MEEIKQIEAKMDALIELRSRYQCQDELYAFARSVKKSIAGGTGGKKFHRFYEVPKME